MQSGGAENGAGLAIPSAMAVDLPQPPPAPAHVFPVEVIPAGEELRPAPVPTVAINAFKGGVSKTTTTYNLAWYFSRNRGLRVLVVDLDSQCSLTQLFLESHAYPLVGIQAGAAFDAARVAHDVVVRRVFRHERPPGPGPEALSSNIGEQLIDIVNGAAQLGDVEIHAHPRNANLHLLAGSRTLSEYEDAIAAAEMSGHPLFSNVPGAVYCAIQRAGIACGADLILLDTSPNPGCLNMIAVMSSSYYMIPCQPDFFSLFALQAGIVRYTQEQYTPRTPMSRRDWVHRMEGMRALASHSQHMRLPYSRPKFLGVLPQMFTTRDGSASAMYHVFIERIRVYTRDRLVPILDPQGMVAHDAGEPGRDYVLAEVPNFNRMNPMAQMQGLPVMALRLHECGRLFSIKHRGDPAPEGVDWRIPLSGNRYQRARTAVADMTRPLVQVGATVLRLMGLGAVAVPLGNDDADGGAGGGPDGDAGGPEVFPLDVLENNAYDIFGDDVDDDESYVDPYDNFLMPSRRSARVSQPVLRNRDLPLPEHEQGLNKKSRLDGDGDGL